MKACKVCAEIKPLESFYRHPQMKDGYLNVCIPCFRAAEKKRRADDPDGIRARDRAYWAKHPEEKRAKDLRYSAQHRAEAIARTKAWADANPDRVKERAVAYYKAHTPRAIQRAYAARLRRAGVAVGHTAEERAAKFAEFGDKCAHCGTTEKITVDHIIPLSKGGDDRIENVQPLCQPCNSHKHNKVGSPTGGG